MAISEDEVIFNFVSYRLFLQDYIHTYYLSKGRSYRAFTKRCGITSPNYFQQVITSHRNMSHQTAEKIVKALGFTKTVSEYFIKLVQLENTTDPSARFLILGDLKKLAARQKELVVKDESFHSSWVHQIIWALAHTKSFDIDPLSIQWKVGVDVPREEIERSFTFLKSKGYLVYDPTESRYRPLVMRVETGNDLINFDLQRNHTKFLQTAILRLNDSITEREFQGLTIAVSKSRWPLLKEKMREFVLQMNEILSDDAADAETVIRLQMAAFTLAESN